MKLQSKADYEKLMFMFLEPLKKYYSEENSRVILKGAGSTHKEEVGEIETFSRPLWALVPFFAGGGKDEYFEKVYLEGFKNGPNKNAKEYWGGFTDGDQRFVEMAAIVTGLLLCKDTLWTPLSSVEKENLASWLYEINNYKIPTNNWHFFRILVNIALKKCNMKYNEQQLQKDLEVIESYYIGNGWYKDGTSEHRDYYVPFAMHYYGLLYSVVMKDDDPQRCEVFKTRAKSFAKDFIYYFANSGEAVPYGRSLTYRFAQCSFFSACLFANVEIFDLGVIKGIINRHFNYWLNQDIFKDDGVLSIGYTYSNLIMSERYNATGSPYWALKSFLLLALDDNHLYWEVEEKPLPHLEKVKHFKEGNLLLQRKNEGNDVVIYLPAEIDLYGHGHFIEKYSKFAYSSAFGFSVMRTAFFLDEAAPDSMLAFVIDDTVFVRKISKEYEILENKIISKWSPFIGIEVTTTIELTENGHKRHHSIKSDYDCLSYDYGYSLPKFTNNFKNTTNNHSIKVISKNLSCEVIDINNIGEPTLLDCFPNTNVLYKNTVIPGIKHIIKKSNNIIETEINTDCIN